MNLKRRIFAIFLSIVMITQLTGCLTEEKYEKLLATLESISEENSPYIDDDGWVTPTESYENSSEPESSESEPESVVSPDKDGTWAIFWYLCGSDLETYGGSATIDLKEMLRVKLPENVKMYVQTGGAAKWQNTEVSAKKSQRFLYDSNGFQKIYSEPMENMGDEETLKSFLQFTKENMADHNAIIFWNHGGGSLSGVSFDENYGMDSLTNHEMINAFDEVYGVDEENPPLDIIGFDACLMASVDTAFSMYGYAKYMIASEEVEPSLGWDYEGFLSELAANPGMSALDLSMSICDTYYEACTQEYLGDTITLSVVDLTKLTPLYENYLEFGNECLRNVATDATFYNGFATTVQSCENYGGNTKDQGYCNMLDLGHFLRISENDLSGTGKKVLQSLLDCVAYRVNGPYRSEATGLSFFYSLDSDYDNFYTFCDEGWNDGLKYFYYYGLTGTMSESAMDYLNSFQDFEDYKEEDMEQILTLNDVDWEDYPVYVDEDGCAVLNLGPLANDILISVYFELVAYSIEDDLILSLGNDNDIYADWEMGIFKDNFRGVWGAIDDYLCYMELSYEGDYYNEYNVPILLNGEKYNLVVIYDFDIEEWIIEGARRPIDEYGATEKEMRILENGDEITTLHYLMTISGDDEDFTEIPIESFIYTEDAQFHELDLGGGDYMLYYALKDSQNNVVYSEPVYITTIDGKIYLSENPPE